MNFLNTPNGSRQNHKLVRRQASALCERDYRTTDSARPRNLGCVPARRYPGDRPGPWCYTYRLDRHTVGLGKCADLIIVDRDPLADIAALQSRGTRRSGERIGVVDASGNRECERDRLPHCRGAISYRHRTSPCRPGLHRPTTTGTCTAAGARFRASTASSRAPRSAALRTCRRSPTRCSVGGSMMPRSERCSAATCSVCFERYWESQPADIRGAVRRFRRLPAFARGERARDSLVTGKAREPASSCLDCPREVRRRLARTSPGPPTAE